MKQLTILHLDFEKTWRGGQQQLFWLADGLRKKGYKNFVVCRSDSSLQKKLAENDFIFFKVPLFFELDPVAIYRTRKIIDEAKPDIIHLHSAHAHTIGVLAARISKHKPKIISSRRVDFHIKSKWKYKNVDRIIAVSEGVKKILLLDGIDDKKISVVHSGVDLSLFKNIDGSYLYDELKIKRDNRIVGIVASLAPHKDHVNFLTAAALIKEKIPEAKFLIVGEGRLKNGLIKLAKKLGIADSVIFTGFRKDVSSLLAIFDVFILSSYLEGLCTSLIDAMASGVPIVATNVGGVGELVTDGLNGILVPPGNPAAFASAVITVLGNKNIGKKFADAGKEKSKKFSKEKMVEGTEKIYLELI